MWYDINRFHILAFITWQFANYFAGQNIFGIYSNNVPKWRCGNSEPTSDCQIYTSCRSNLTFVDPPFNSAAMELNWICGLSTWNQAFFSQIQFAGLLVGTLFFGTLSDRFGRKPIGILVISNGICSTFASGLAPTATVLFVLRFFVGLSIGGMLVVLCAWIMEVILPQQRMVVRGCFNWGWTRIALTVVCYFTREWRLASFTTAITLVPALLLVIFVIPESPVWLHSKGFKSRMIQSEMHIARVAGIPYAPVEHKVLRPKGLIETLKTKGMFKTLSVLWSMWFIVAICGGAIDLNSGKLSGDLYLNQMLFGILLVFSKMLLLYVDTNFHNFKRRTLHQGSLIGTLICVVIMACYTMSDYHGVAVLVTYLIGTVFIEYTWDACYLCAVELVETPSRASATGSCSLAARVGMILAPILTNANLWWPYSVSTTVMVLGTSNLLVSYFFLQESKGVNLDDVHTDDSIQLQDVHELRETEAMVQKVRD
ncbi:Protein CBG05850 [Caenorhabditis briggsae]|uniref:Major facilitator superfamily (MFS) profile domain-containing protein n=2 Tax=Caenorhabditis briggsae TaxID=6238 RepID=A0AAE9D4L7_CAEBR|nr:Protein CBG05850 [Caenorhabditis briggsae]ULT95081.1 hypothetical protein L3Y34_004074 [Caenorhabditis briggsae]UMM28287.1 hypothetical protein L5515_011196 [Caenorhabditis briggsae]CAP26484.1 Protein CBG05850 [Caenorhabditis briggsae]